MPRSDRSASASRYGNGRDEPIEVPVGDRTRRAPILELEKSTE